MTAPARAAADLFAQAAAAEHAATIAIQRGDVPAAHAHATIGRLRYGLALRQAAAECLFCNGYGAVADKCPPGCLEHDEPGRTGRHWTSCPNVVAHPPTPTSPQ